jgi:hypothetical protein
MSEYRPLSESRRQALVPKCEAAVRGGREILPWVQESIDRGELDLFELERTADSAIRGFVGQIRQADPRSSVVGCLQDVQFHRSADAGRRPPVSLREWLDTRFFEEAQFRHPDGLPGGFGYNPLLGKLSGGGGVVMMPQPGEQKFAKPSEVGRRYDWVTMQVEIYDFVRCVPALKPYVKQASKLIKEAAYVALAPEFQQFKFPADPDVAASCTLGYSFVPATVHANIFGYGPGRFGIALKFFRFALLKSGDIRVTMLFLSVPRSEGVFYFWGFDPMYGSARLADLVTLGRARAFQKIRDKFDRQFMLQHGIVHRSAIEGLRATWEGTNWQP